MTIEMYVISNGELAREALNAVATLLGDNTFDTALKIGILFSIYGAVINYIHGRNIAAFAKWFIVYFGITAIMLTPKVTVKIVDVSNPRAGYTVANVPYGLGYPASIITRTAHGLIETFETAFHTPDDLSYNKTGMLFGSKLFKISSEFNAVNPEVKSQLNEYVKNCVLGDILISKKYTMTDLTDSTNLLETITQNTSNIRGIYIGGVFKTCKEATSHLKQHLETDTKTNLLNNLGKKLGLAEVKSTGVGGMIRRVIGLEETKKAERLLATTYNYFFNYSNLSKTALEIATQNILINGIRDGLLNYTAETGATAALLNLSTTQAMDKMRMTLATSRNIALYTIPIIHTILLLLMLSLFPIIVLIALQPSLTGTVLKNYLYTLCWIESWPLMFSCLNMMVTFYAQELGPGGLTISNIDKLLLEHSDISNMAGYLMLSIPFISGGLVKGMSSAFNHAASYIGGVMQSSSSSAASEAASGNIHLGNSSWNNVNANKFDTNSTLMHGMATEQLKTGVLRTSRPDGETTYDGTPAISKLPTSVRSSDVLSSSFSEQAEKAEMASIDNRETYDQSLSSAASNLNSLGKTMSSGQSFGEGSNLRQSFSDTESVSSMIGIAESVAKRNDMSVDDALKGLINTSIGGDFNVGASIPKLVGYEVGVKGKMGAEGVRSSETSTRSSDGRSININAEELQRFNKDLHKVEEYGKTKHAENSSSDVDSKLSQFSTDIRDARTASEQYTVNKSKSEKLNKAASYVDQHSRQIDSDLGQKVANYSVKKRGREEAEELFAGKNNRELEADAREYIENSGIKSSIISRYQSDSVDINPNKMYQSGKAAVENKKGDMGVDYAERTKSIKDKRPKFNQQKFGQINNEVENKQKEFNRKLIKKEDEQDDKYYKMKNEVAGDIKEGEKKSRSSVFTNKIKPDFLKRGGKKEIQKKENIKEENTEK